MAMVSFTLPLPHLCSFPSSSQSPFRMPPAPRIRSSSSGGFTEGNVFGKSYQAGANGDYTVLLKKKAGEMVDDLKGTCIYLLGMTGSGKSSVGKRLAESLGYYFFDSDKLIEEAAGDGRSVSQLMKEEDSESFRDAETEVLKQLSCMGRLVIATGVDTVLRPTNWSYLRYGVTVWLNVPVEALALRASGPMSSASHSFLENLATFSSHSEALESLSSMLDVRKRYYENADASISLMKLASEYGHEDLDNITAEMVALQVLQAIDDLMKCRSK